ncbi:cytochrome P450 [Phanerochaete sordida]|uniref:Cytochrome P450 n=1 Tax=Phanerochaete sordida TaxID=48140 RepID=A0A9P3GN96_9APHY|nr:cytochrome P450 [Phanerochaete sordida]
MAVQILHLPTAYLWAMLFSAALVALRLRKRPRYPPGPPGLPVVGNFFDVPKHYAWVRFWELGQQLGSDVVHLQVLGTHIVVLNSAKAVRDLLEKRSNIYSDRDYSVMIHELTGNDRNIVFMQYGEQWRAHRKLLHQHFRPQVVSQYHAAQTKGVRGLLRSLLDAPEAFTQHIRFMAGATALDVVFAMDVKPGDPIIKIAEDAVTVGTEVVMAGVHLVDMLPILKHLPSWLPGGAFKRKAAEWKVMVDGLFDIPYGRYKDSMLQSDLKPCLSANLLASVENGNYTPEIEEMFKSVTGTTYAGGSDTTVSTLSVFLFAMTFFPEAQLTAQAQLDHVLCQKRLPEIEDRDSLPEITALVHEVLRWHAVLPLAAPHRITTDDEYNGYVIPAGSVIFGNTWAILHDESVYPDPDVFKPARFLDEDGSLRADVPYPTEAFGYGRRICPGRYFAHDILWLAIAHILSVFTVARELDEQGKETVPERGFTPMLLSMPKPFKCRFVSRFPGAESLICGTSVLE